MINIPILHLTLPFIYFTFYYSILHYLRLGQTISLLNIVEELNLSEILNYIVLVIFIWPFISIWFRLLLWKLIDLRLLLSEETLFLLKSINVLLLKHDKYFKIMELFFKISFIWISYFISNIHIYRKEPRNYLRTLLFKLYKRPLLFSIIILIICFIELLIKNGCLYYTQYIIMILLFLRPLVYFLNQFNNPDNSWVSTCCYADYIYANWHKPKYPIQFWLSFNDIRKGLKHKPKISQNFHNTIQKYINILIRKRHQELSRNLRILHKYDSKQKTSYLNRTKVAYNQWSQIRWVHTEIAAPTTLWHRLTQVFARTWLEKVALINKHWSHYHLIEQLDNKKRFPILKETWYQDFFTPETTIMESNVITYLKELTDTYSQKYPNTIFDGHESSKKNKRVHGLDQKAEEKPIQGRTKKPSDVRTGRYHRLLDTLYAEMVANTINMSLENLQKVEKALVSLKITCKHFAKHQLVYTSNRHLFPENYIPPFRMSRLMYTIGIYVTQTDDPEEDT